LIDNYINNITAETKMNKIKVAFFLLCFLIFGQTKVFTGSWGNLPKQNQVAVVIDKDSPLQLLN